MKKLNPWQKFWGLFAVVFLATAVSVVATQWPTHDPAVVAALRAPECSEWRNLPAGTFRPESPQTADRCHFLRELLYRKHISLRSEADYDAYLTKQGIRNMGITLGIWAGFVLAIYFLGWSSGRLARVLRGKADPNPGQPGAT